MKLAALFLACGAAAAQPAADTVKLDNEYVRVSFPTDTPHSKTPLHKHEFNRVMIYLDPTALVLRYQDGEVDRQRWRKGQVAWSPGGRLHTGENLFDHPARVVEVELKKPPSGKPFVPSARDPVKVNAKNARVELENQWVRVLRVKYRPNVPEPVHEHTSERRLTIPLEAATLKVKTEGAEDRTESVAAGDALWSTGTVVHAAQADRAVELIVVEIK